MTGQTIVAARAPDGVRITWYARGGTIVAQTTLEWRRALLLGADLINLACERVLRADQGQEKDPPADGGGR